MHQFLMNNDPIKHLVKQKQGVFKHTTDMFNLALITADFIKNNHTIFVVLPTLYQAQKYYDQLILSIKEEDVLFYPADELITAEMLVSSKEFKLERINTIQNLMQDKAHVVVTHYNGAIKYQLPEEDWMNATITLRLGDQLALDKLVRKLHYSGYKKVYTVEKVGEFSQRGSIIDVFPLTSEHPVRLDFFDIELDRIKLFDVVGQKSFGSINEITITPLNELFFTDEMLEKAKIFMNELIENNLTSDLEKERLIKDVENLNNRDNLDGLTRYIRAFSSNPKTILEFTKNPKIYIVDTPKIRLAEERVLSDLDEYCRSVKGYTIFKLDYFMKLDTLLNKFRYLEAEGLLSSRKPNAYSVYAKETDTFHGDINAFSLEMLRLNANKKTTLLCIEDQTRMSQLINTLDEHQISYNVSDNILEGTINILKSSYPFSFDLYDKNIIIHNEQSIFKPNQIHRKIRYKSVFSESTKIKRIEELIQGDYIVHYEYGIGRYLGLKSMELSGVMRDYIHVLYDNDDFLYVPIEQIDLIQKYGASEGAVPKLTRLGTTQWVRTKQRVKDKINDISDKLIDLYAKREASKGHAFSPDQPLQYAFERDFMFDETKDQLAAIHAVKADMESDRPMDRLICGDVGYGKTEVAMRAAFKAVMDGKQVAYLAPTTVLSRQHYYSFIERFEKFGVNLALMNRFTTPSEQKEILKRLAMGLVDIVIGTHRLLSQDMVFKDLGLLIIDEEQRFGVEHKERIKEMKVNVDTITLTATPIPRTLQMAIMGIKSLSMIETPPKNRYPIQTYVLERHDTVIKEAIERELARNGQVFYLYNRVYDIEVVTAKIQKLVPEARVVFAHGQMNRTTIEDVISQFIDKEFDVLVCTTIIETGIDIPNTNTLIIHEADRLGLSQLYQIRGRVGRSDRIAYAYLMHDRNKRLTENSEKRLQVIKDFTELGSGFKIAMRDLSIRGAGDILGDEQSGFIDSVGIDLYMKILDETIKEKQGIEVKKDTTSHELGEVLTSRHISENYINNDDVRIEIHKRIHSLSTRAEIEELKEDLEDRFGKFDQSLVDYMLEKLLKKQARLMGSERIIHDKKTFKIILSVEASNQSDGQRLFLTAQEFSKAFIFAYERKKIHIGLDLSKIESNYLDIFTRYLDKILS